MPLEERDARAELWRKAERVLAPRARDLTGALRMYMWARGFRGDALLRPCELRLDPATLEFVEAGPGSVNLHIGGFWQDLPKIVTPGALAPDIVAWTFVAKWGAPNRLYRNELVIAMAKVTPSAPDCRFHKEDAELVFGAARIDDFQDFLAYEKAEEDMGVWYASPDDHRCDAILDPYSDQEAVGPYLRKFGIY